MTAAETYLRDLFESLENGEIERVLNDLDKGEGISMWIEPENQLCQFATWETFAADMVKNRPWDAERVAQSTPGRGSALVFIRVSGSGFSSYRWVIGGKGLN
jgi:hypothetical protein